LWFQFEPKVGKNQTEPDLQTLGTGMSLTMWKTGWMCDINGGHLR
jgi:hypothetical protein